MMNRKMWIPNKEWSIIEMHDHFIINSDDKIKLSYYDDISYHIGDLLM